MAYINSTIRDKDTKKRLGISEVGINDFATSVTKTNVYLDKKQKAEKKALSKTLVKEISEAASVFVAAKKNEELEEEIER